MIGAGVIAVDPPTTPRPTIYVTDIQLVSGDEPDIVIDVVRHAQMISPFEDELTPSPAFPGAPLSDLGQQQAQDLATKLFDQLGPHVAGIFEGQGLREMETAAPFAGLENMTGNVPVLPGLDEIDSGIYALDPIDSTGGQLAFLTAGAWSLGSPFGLSLLQAPGSSDINGIVFDARFTDAIDSMYDAALADPVVSADGQITDVAFNSEASIFVWALDNVKNPDLSFFINRIIEAHTVPDGLSTVLLPNTGVVQIEGNPTDGWTLVSWDGQAIPQDPDLLSSLFVDVRDVALPEQAAEWNIWEAIVGGDSTTIINAVQTGFEQVDSALAQLPESIFNSISDALTNLVATEAGAQAGTTLSDALATLF
jgi:broad specificity phosphatase PhoE